MWAAKGAAEDAAILKQKWQDVIFSGSWIGRSIVASEKLQVKALLISVNIPQMEFLQQNLSSIRNLRNSPY